MHTFRNLLELEHIDKGFMFTEDQINEIVERARFFLGQFEKARNEKVADWGQQEMLTKLKENLE